MCGIVGFIGKEQKAINVLINGLKHLEYRGYDSAGIAFINNKKLNIIKEKGRISNLENNIPTDVDSNLGIGHTRWATHGIASKENAHPHRSNNITIVHNGIIENYLEIKNELLEKGYSFLSETDTEVASALLDYYYNVNNNDIIKAIIDFEKKAIGAYAIGIIVNNDYDNLYAIKKGSPLIIGVGNNENYIASDVPAIISYTRKYITLNDGEFAKINSSKIEVYDKDGNIIKKDIREFEGDPSSIDKCGYDHYMLKEIFEEPVVIKNNIDNSIPDISKYKNITIVACGSAMHAGLVGKYLIEKYGNIKVDVEIASEFRYKKLFINKDTLVIAISQSGETADTLEAVKISKKLGSHTLGIINVKESSIARECDSVIYTNAGSEIAVATTKAYLAQVEILSLLAYKISNKNLDEVKNYIDDLKKLPVIIEELLNNKELYYEIANDIYNKNDIFFIGRGIDYALCMEGSLKLKEISYLHSEAYAAGELKHGTISLIEDGTPVIGVVTDKSISDKTISNLKEVKSRGANVILLTTTDIDKEGDFYNKKIIIPSINPLLQPLADIIPLQLIAYKVARLNNCDIDKPKNLAKSVTVE